MDRGRVKELGSRLKVDPRGMKDSGVEWIGEIPEEWEVGRLKNYYYVFSGATPKSGEEAYWNGDITWITPADYKTSDVVIKDSSRKITNEGLNSCGTKLVPINSIIISNRAPIGAVALAGVELCTNQGCKSLVRRRATINNKYTYYFLSVMTAPLNMLGRGTTFLELSTFDLSNFRISIAPYMQQQIIADYLDSKVSLIDDIIEKTKQSIEDYKKYKQSLITETVTKGLNPDVEMKDSGIEWIGEIPKQWQAVRLKNVTRLRNEKISNNDSVSYIGLEDIESKTGRIIPKVNKEKQFIGGTANVFYEGDVLFGKLRPYLAKCIVADFNGKCSTELLVIQAVGGFMNNLYLKYLMLSGSFIDLVNSSTYGTKMPRASWDFIREQYIPMPTYREQKQIADYLDKKCLQIDKVIEQKETLINELEMYKKSLIYEYVTGKKRVEMQE